MEEIEIKFNIDSKQVHVHDVSHTKHTKSLQINSIPMGPSNMFCLMVELEKYLISELRDCIGKHFGPK